MKYIPYINKYKTDILNRYILIGGNILKHTFLKHLTPFLVVSSCKYYNRRIVLYKLLYKGRGLDIINEMSLKLHLPPRSYLNESYTGGSYCTLAPYHVSMTLFIQFSCKAVFTWIEYFFILYFIYFLKVFYVFSRLDGDISVKTLYSPFQPILK